MGREISERIHQTPLEKRPSILIVGTQNSGKRTIISRLLSEDLSEMPELTSEYSCFGWIIDTKYYTAELAIWTAHIHDDFPLNPQLTNPPPSALVMVFDLSSLSSFAALQDWASSIDLHEFEILLCVGNKADLLPGHFAHRVYRRRLQKHGENSSDPHPEFHDYGIFENEGCSLLSEGEEEDEEESSAEIRKSCLDWCMNNNIEYVEACAANAEFDKCLSIDGDLQGVGRIYGALSAYLWPGLTMKSVSKTPDVDPVEDFREKDDHDFSDEESDIVIEYEVLSGGSAEPLDDLDPISEGSSESSEPGDTSEVIMRDNPAETPGCSTSHEHESTEDTQQPAQPTENRIQDSDKESHQSFEELERLMSDISHVRENLRLMPDSQRKEMAAQLAMKMATMFGESDDEAS